MGWLGGVACVTGRRGALAPVGFALWLHAEAPTAIGRERAHKRQRSGDRYSGGLTVKAQRRMIRL